MRTILTFNRVIFLGLLLGAGVQSHASLIITDSNSQNPLFFAFPSSTCATPPNQFDFFTLGGNPTVSGGAAGLGLNLNISGDDGLELTARHLSGNQAALIQALLFDADGTILRFDYPTSDFIPGFNMDDVTAYEVQGDFFDGGGVAPFSMRFDDQIATSAVPEPSSGAPVSLGVCLDSSSYDVSSAP
jgi:hypothetical protein